MRTWTARLTGLIVSWLLLLSPALYNAYPITFYDTGGYLERWFDLTLTMGRSLAYGLFLGVTAGGLSADGGSLWGTIAVQAGLALWLLHLTLRCLEVAMRPLVLPVVVAVLTVTTGLPWYTAQIMPDILEPLMVLALYLLAFRRAALSVAEQLGLAALVALAVACHMAHLGLGVGLVAATALLVKGTGLRRLLGPVSLGLPVMAMAAGLGLLLAVDAGFAGQAELTPGGESFVFGRLVQDGIAKRFLDDHCPSPDFRLCAYRDRLPATADDFIWGKGSPFAEIGGWETGGAEMARITRDSVAAYPLMHLRSAVAATGEQLLRVRLGIGLTEWHGHTLAMFRERLLGHNPTYLAARQQRHEIGFSGLNRYQVPIALAAMVGLAASIPWLVRRRDFPAASLAGFVTTALLGNAFICGALSNPNDRYENRLVWLALFALMVIGQRVWQSPPGSDATSRTHSFQ